MAALNSTTYTKQANGSKPIPGYPQAAGVVFAQQVTIAVPSTGAGTALNDTLGLFYVPKGAVIVDFRLDVDDLDSNGSPTLTYDVGDSGSAVRIMSASVAGQAAGRQNCLNAALGYQFTADTAVFATVHAAAATKAAGNLTATIEYTMPGQATS